MKSSKRARHVLAGVVLALAALAAAMVWLAHRQLAGLHAAPITLGQATADTLWVHLHDTLHAFDARGERIARIADAEIGLPAPVLHLHAVQRDDLLVAAGSPPRVKRCTPSARSCRDVDHGYIAAFRRFDNKVWIGANADASRVVVVDNAAHRVAVLDGEGVLIASAGSERFDYPSQAVWDGEAGFWLANSEKSRLERIGVDADAGTLTAAQREVKLSVRDTILLGRTWPMALAAAGDGGLWVVPKKTWIGPGGLVHLSAAGTFDRDRTLPADADFTAVTRMGDALIAADFNGPRLHRIALDGVPRSEPFGGAAFAAELQAHAAQQAHWARLQQWALGALIGLPLLGALLLAAMGERLPVAPAGFERPRDVATESVAPAASGPVCIGLTRKHRRAQWIALGLSVPVLVVVGSYTAYNAAAAGGLEPLGAVGVALRVLYGITALLVLAVLVTSVRTARREWSKTLTVHDGRVRLEAVGKTMAEAALAECWTDGKAILIDGVWVGLVQRQAIFEPDAVRAHLLARLPADHWVSSGRLQRMMLRELWRRRPVVVAVVTLGFALLIASSFVPAGTVRPWVDHWLAPQAAK